MSVDWQKLYSEHSVQQRPYSPPRMTTVQRLHEKVKLAEPWSIMIAAIALVISISAFVVESLSRTDERIVRAWQLITTTASGNSGKVAALEYLNELGEPLIGIDLGANGADEGVFLGAIDLSHANLAEADLSGAYLFNSWFTGAWLINTSFRRANLSESRFGWANIYERSVKVPWLNSIVDNDLFHGQIFESAYLEGADFTEARLWGTDFGHAYLMDTNFQGADLSSASLFRADLRGADLSTAKGIDQADLDEACGNVETRLPANLSIPMCSNVDW